MESAAQRAARGAYQGFARGCISLERMLVPFTYDLMSMSFVSSGPLVLIRLFGKQSISMELDSLSFQILLANLKTGLNVLQVSSHSQHSGGAIRRTLWRERFRPTGCATSGLSARRGRAPSLVSARLESRRSSHHLLGTGHSRNESGEPCR